MQIYRPGMGKFSSQSLNKKDDGESSADALKSNPNSEQREGGGGKGKRGSRVFHNRSKGNKTQAIRDKEDGYSKE